MMIDGKTRTLGLLGDPVEHTMSPLIHNTLSETLGLNNVYVPFHTKAEAPAYPYYSLYIHFLSAPGY